MDYYQNLVDSLLFSLLELAVFVSICWKLHSYGKRIEELERKIQQNSSKDPDEFWRKYRETKPK